MRAGFQVVRNVKEPKTIFTIIQNFNYRRPNICLTWKTVPEGLGAACAEVSEANGTSRDKGFVRLKRLLDEYILQINI
jgi:hypothetical protein